MWLGSVVPVSGSMPTCCANRNTICAGCTPYFAASEGRRATTWRFAVSSEKPWYVIPSVRQSARISASQPQLGVAAVLDVGRAHGREVEELAELAGGHVADAERGGGQGFHRTPRLAVVGAEPVAL